MTEADNVTPIPKKDEITVREPNVFDVATLSGVMMAGAADERVFGLLDRMQNSNPGQQNSNGFAMMSILLGNTMGKPELRNQVVFMLADMAGYENVNDVPPSALPKIIKKLTETSGFKDFLTSAQEELTDLLPKTKTPSKDTTPSKKKK